MIRITFAVMFLVLGLAGVALAQDPGFPGSGDPWNQVPQPSGLRFAGYGVDGGYGCGPCGCGYGPCLHWTQYSWYGHWPKDGYGAHHKKHGCGCGNGCNTGCNTESGNGGCDTCGT